MTLGFGVFIREKGISFLKKVKLWLKKALPVDPQQRQPAMRFYSRGQIMRTCVGVLARRNRLDLI